MGVLDPTKVTRYALQNAASIAGLILTTDAMVAESPKEESGGGHGGHGMVAWVEWAAWTCNARALRYMSAHPSDGCSITNRGEPRFPSVTSLPSAIYRSLRIIPARPETLS